MKEIDPLHQDNTRDEQKQHGQIKQGSKHIPRGLKVWQIDPETEIPMDVQVKAAIQLDKVLGTRGLDTLTVKQTHLKVDKNPNFFYCMAINSKNALRKYFKSPFYAAIRRKNQTPGDSPRNGNQ